MTEYSGPVWVTEKILATAVTFGLSS